MHAEILTVLLTTHAAIWTEVAIQEGAGVCLVHAVIFQVRWRYHKSLISGRDILINLYNIHWAGVGFEEFLTSIGILYSVGTISGIIAPGFSTTSAWCNGLYLDRVSFFSAHCSGWDRRWASGCLFFCFSTVSD